jgi:serine/threonine protein kinase, bacterial
MNQPQLLANRYQTIKHLGSGGFGDTFLAKDTHSPTEKTCVIKQLKPLNNDPKIYQLVKDRFKREAVILEELGNSNSQIPSLSAYFEEKGLFYLVQEYIEGETLADLVEKQGILNEVTVKNIVVETLTILEFVQSQGIIHRDIKPDNIIIRQRDNKAILIDFGAVRETMATQMTPSGHSTASIIIGTPGFMPPEQTAGRPVFSSDLYALGLTAIYLLTGKMPQDLTTDPMTGELQWRQFTNQISPHFANILDQAINTHLNQRFINATMMKDALLGNYTTTIVSPLSSLPIQSEINPKTNYKIIPIIIGFCLIGGGFWLYFNQSEREVKTSQIESVNQQQNNQEIKNQETEIKQNQQQELEEQLAEQQKQIDEQKRLLEEQQKAIEEAKNQPPVIVQTVQPNPSTINNNSANNSGFYFVQDSAFANSNEAQNQVNNLKVNGYSGAGYFWIPDYPNLSGKAFYAVYPAKFSNRSDCANLLQSYSQINSEVYCVYASKNANDSPDRFYAR